MIARLVAAFALLALWAAPLAAKTYSDAEMANFHVADVKLGMSLSDATAKLSARKYQPVDDGAGPGLAKFVNDAKAVITLDLDEAKKVKAIGFTQPLPEQASPDMLQRAVVPSLIQRFGEPTKQEMAGETIVLAYLTEKAGVNAPTLTLRASKLGIDGRLGR